MTKQDLIVRLFEIGAVKFGSFTLKSGITSPFYINLRQIISYPDILTGAGKLLSELLPPDYTYRRIAGVPYSGIPIASAISLHNNKPIIIPRKEEKTYGSKDAILGDFNSGDTCLLIEDLITTGESILETVEVLETAGLQVTGACVLIDRRAVRNDFQKEYGIRLFPLITIEEMINVLLERGLLGAEDAQAINRFLMTSAVKSGAGVERGAAVNLVTMQLRKLMQDKQSNVILSLDVETSDEFFTILEATADDIVMVKTHVDILKDFSEGFIHRLQEIAEKRRLMIFEDRKFADIGNTVRMQYRGGIHHIADWAAFVTVHMIPGEAILRGLFDGLEGRSSFLLARMSAKDNLITENYTRKVLELGRKNSNVVSGFIGHGTSEAEIRKLRNKIPEDMLLLMPGVQLQSTGDGLGQQYITPAMAVSGGANAIIVGRGITHAPKPAEAARSYREAAWIQK